MASLTPAEKKLDRTTKYVPGVHRVLEQKKEYYKKNRDKILAYAREHYKHRKATDKTFRLKYRISSKESYIRNRQEKLDWQKEYWKTHRILLLNYLGGAKCVMCGYDKDWRAIQIDHVNGGGNKDPFRTRKPNLFLKFLQKNPGERNKYQVLCANCNRIKAVENGEHRERRDESEIVDELQGMKRELEKLHQKNG